MSNPRMELSTATALLGVKLPCPPERVTKAYRLQALLHHPDRAGQDSTALFQSIVAAYEYCLEHCSVPQPPPKPTVEEDDFDFDFIPTNITSRPKGRHQPEGPWDEAEWQRFKIPKCRINPIIDLCPNSTAYDGGTTAYAGRGNGYRSWTDEDRVRARKRMAAYITEVLEPAEESEFAQRRQCARNVNIGRWHLEHAKAVERREQLEYEEKVSEQASKKEYYESLAEKKELKKYLAAKHVYALEDVKMVQAGHVSEGAGEQDEQERIEDCKAKEEKLRREMEKRERWAEKEERNPDNRLRGDQLSSLQRLAKDVVGELAVVLENCEERGDKDGLKEWRRWLVRWEGRLKPLFGRGDLAGVEESKGSVARIGCK